MRRALPLLLPALLATACGDEATEPGPQTPADAGTFTPLSLDAGFPGVDDGAPDSGVMAAVDEVDPGCVDGQYAEVLPEASADLSGPLASFDANAPKPFILAALDARYPTGRYLVEQGLTKTRIGDCVEAFLSDRSSGQAVAQQMSTLVHECGHFLNIGESGFSDQTYVIREDLRFSCEGGGMTFARSRISQDAYSASYPPCGTIGRGCDGYARIYLDGDPDDATFDSGDQGFDMLLEETVQYVNSLATGYAFADQNGRFRAVSERDGILVFLWYVERYLKMAREQHPATYEILMNSPCWREAILTTWGRAWLYLETTADMPALGIDHTTVIELVRTPELLAEIERVRDAHGCN